MNTNFFKQIQALDFTGVLQLSISKGLDNNLVVTVLLNNEGCGDRAKDMIPPLIFNATPEEFDEGFFQQISQPIKQVSGLRMDMETFLKQLETAKKQSAMEKSKTEKVKKELDSKEKKFNDAMALADKLEKEGKFSEAWMKLPDPLAFPDFAETIRNRKTELSNKFAPDLFGNVSEVKPKQLESSLIQTASIPKLALTTENTTVENHDQQNIEIADISVYDDEPEQDDEYTGFDENEDNYEPF